MLSKHINGNTSISKVVALILANLSDEDGDNRSSNTVVPFQIDYALSIHKAQELEYNSVKIVITGEVEEKVIIPIKQRDISKDVEILKLYLIDKFNEGTKRL